MLIECSITNCLIFIPFIFPIFHKASILINDKYINDEFFFFKIFRYYLSHTLSIIFIIIIKCRTMPGRYSSVNKLQTENSKSRKSSIWINPLDIVQKKLKKGKKRKSIYFLILLLTISFISNFIHKKFFNYKMEYGRQSIYILFEIFFFILFSVMILKEKLYKHQLFSFWVISFTLLIEIIYLIIYTKEKILLNAIWYYFINSLFYSLYDVLGKKYMNLYFDTPYNIMFKIGLILCIIIIIYEIIFYYYVNDYSGKYSGIILAFKNNTNFADTSDTSDKNNKFFFFIFFISIILEFLYNLGIWLTIYYFNPCYFIISELFSECIHFIYNLITPFYEITKIEILLFSISYIINIISSLIFNEIIIINYYELSEYTKKRIKERERYDTLYAFKNFIDSGNGISGSLGSNL